MAKAETLFPSIDASDGRPLFSIVTITFNSRDQLRRTARGVAEQTLTDFEWIVIDGGSTDGTLDDLSSYSHLSYWMSEPDNGISDAWNKGIRRATGRQIVILNAGDTFDAECLAVLSKSVSSDRITCCNARISTETGVIVGTFAAEPAKLWRGMHLPHNWAFVPRDFYDKQQFGLYREIGHSMDFEWFHRFYIKFGKHGFRIVDQTLGTYYLGGVSDSGYLKSFQANERILRENNMPPLFARILQWVYMTKHRIVHRLLPRLKRRKP